MFLFIKIIKMQNNVVLNQKLKGKTYHLSTSLFLTANQVSSILPDFYSWDRSASDNVGIQVKSTTGGRKKSIMINKILMSNYELYPEGTSPYLS